MHQHILRSKPLPSAGTGAPLRVRLVANAAGALLPSLALELRDVFAAPPPAAAGGAAVAGVSAVVLPSYGMAECMPISTPPLSPSAPLAA